MSEIARLKDFKPRLYQETILETVARYNSLVILPTGMGKTAVAFMLAAQRLNSHPKSKILILAPTKPLVQQHVESFKKYLEIDDNDDYCMVNGSIKPEKRVLLYQQHRVIFSTPQGLENDIISKRIDLSEFSLIVFDEAHHAVGEYAYNFIAKAYNDKARYPRMLGLTASPGADMTKITEVCTNLFIEDIEIRTDTDPDVKPYVKDIKIEWVKVELPPEFKSVNKFLTDCYRSKLKDVKNRGFAPSGGGYHVSKTEVLKLQARLQGNLARGERDFDTMKAVSVLAEAMKVEHAVELLETQGINSLSEYVEKILSDSKTTKTKATQNLVKDVNFRSALVKIRHLMDMKIEHPKLKFLQSIIKREFDISPKRRLIVFSQYRDSASTILERLKEIPGVKPALFVGQMKKKGIGLSQKEQKEVIDKFRNDEYNVLVATSVAEEGLDIPSVDAVVFYEPIPSAIRHIQRRGRTGRQDEGKAIVLMAKNTRDEGYRWSAHHKEKRMHRVIKDLKKKLVPKLREKQYGIKPKKILTSESPDVSSVNRKLNEFFEENDTTIFADTREKASGVVKDLANLGIAIKTQRLESADYVISSRVGIEYKKVADFVDSIIDGRLLSQLKKLKDNFERPVIIIEGKTDIYSQRNIHPNAIRGMLTTIMISYGIPLMQTKDTVETANLLAMMAKREKGKSNTEFNPHSEKKNLTIKDHQEYVMSSLPGIGPTLAKPLLEEFGTIKDFVNSDIKSLTGIDQIGSKKARIIKNILEKKYAI